MSSLNFAAKTKTSRFLKYFFILLIGCCLIYFAKWWGIAYLYMAFMIALRSNKNPLRDWRLILRYLFVFFTSVYALTNSKQFGLIYLSIASYLITSDLFEIQK